MLLLVCVFLTSLHGVACLEFCSSLTRRRALLSIASSATTASLQFSTTNPCQANDSPYYFSYETRDRKGNKDSVIKEDYWYMLGKTPPRRLDAPLKGDDPQWNAFGACTSSATGGNSCTYVPLKQRSTAYSKYSFAISDGAKEYQKLGQLLQKAAATSSTDEVWQEAASYLTTQQGYPPPAILDAELKMVLFATALLTSPNFPGPYRELLVARFYVNEAHFAAKEMKHAIDDRDDTRALQAWNFGKDSWNSYFEVVNRSIVPKVGEKLRSI